MNSHNMRGKTKKFLKTILKKAHNVQDMRFSDWSESRTSPQCKSPKTCVTKF